MPRAHGERTRARIHIPMLVKLSALNVIKISGRPIANATTKTKYDRSGGGRLGIGLLAEAEAVLVEVVWAVRMCVVRTAGAVLLGCGGSQT